MGCTVEDGGFSVSSFFKKMATADNAKITQQVAITAMIEIMTFRFFIDLFDSSVFIERSDLISVFFGVTKF